MLTQRAGRAVGIQMTAIHKLFLKESYGLLKLRAQLTATHKCILAKSKQQISWQDYRHTNDS